MPLIAHDSYKAPWFLPNGHIQTIYPVLCRKVSIALKPRIFTIIMADGDFIDLDYYDKQSGKTLIVSHGLEGNSSRAYILGMARAFLAEGWNVVAWNYRGCSGRSNNTIKFYHSGCTEDLGEVVNFAANIGGVTQIALAGFSLGGNVVLKYLGNTAMVNQKITHAVAISVPLDLHQGCRRLSESSNYLYEMRFLRTLKQKIRDKAVLFPELDLRHLAHIHDLQKFDDYYTAPLHGFADALDYYRSCSSLFVLDEIKIPTLIINAKNDPFLPESCFPHSALADHHYIFLETPAHGGHVGFTAIDPEGRYWSETRALQFVE
ncbi:MAG: alpha/beta fold hydrolase [Cyclobacteriaceae bacterium]|nr:alpha/beta fold hydrolase [Cyclobacteriaceae bacterium]